MSSTIRRTAVWPSAVIGIALGLVPLQYSAGAGVALEPTWDVPAYAAVREQVENWLTETDASSPELEAIRSLWPAAEGSKRDVDLLDRLVESYSVLSPDAAELQKLCSSPYAGPPAPSLEWLAEADVPPFIRDNIRLFYARWLAQHGLYDEVLEQIGDLRPAAVVDPASLLFYQMAAYHQLVMPDEARNAMVQLLEREDRLPPRYQQIAQLVSRDLAALEDESLDHIARRMRDIRRRLDYGRAGEHVQEIEEGVVKSLDKKIEDLEKQCKPQSGASAGAAPSSKPMEDSRLAELKAAMQVDRRDIGHQAGWGDLPPKERQQALQQIGRDFPTHYRELIEQYFRELAAEETASSN